MNLNTDSVKLNFIMLKPSPGISRVNVELKINVSETSVSVIRVDVVNDHTSLI
jgi:hypothetical protein